MKSYLKSDDTVFKQYLEKRNRRILEARKKGKLLKLLASEFNLTERHIQRILKKMS
ncbi:hypothetical protein LR007_01855 [candidate division NPL-UPA2 bacterium]|nr:hypothetical protein [candidate division NPL-UPA2 bacterium]